MNAAEYQQGIIDLTNQAVASTEVRPADIIATLETTKHSIMHAIAAKAAKPQGPKIFTPTFMPPNDLGKR